MKNIFSIPCFLFITNISIAQIYHSFPDSSASWSETNYTYLPTSERDYDGWKFETSNDTIISGKNYTLLGFQDATFHIYVDLSNSWLSSSQNFSINHPGNIVGAFREDSTKKVWFRALGNDFHFNNSWGGEIIFPKDSDIIIYDFNLNLGDTVAWKSEGKIVLSVDSIQLLNGEYRKIFEFGGDGIQTSGSKWIEGIGSDIGFFGAYEISEFESWSRLSCFHFQDSLLYENISAYQQSCDVAQPLITIEPKSKMNFSFYPNPAAEQLIIENGQLKITEIKIADVVGRTVFIVNSKPETTNQKLTLDISNLPSGMYFIELTDSEKKLCDGKFVIVR